MEAHDFSGTVVVVVFFFFFVLFLFGTSSPDGLLESHRASHASG